VPTTQVLAGVVAAQTALKLTDIDPRYFVGTYYHEAGCVNEWDTEIATASSPMGFISVGGFQIGNEESQRYGYQLSDMLDLDKATSCMVRMAQDNRATLRYALKLTDDVHDPDYTDGKGVTWAGGNMRAYLAMAHNHGTGYTRATLAKYGMDWAAYKSRNATDPLVAHGYGEDCITGGANYPGQQPVIAPGSRTLILSTPPMTGEDVRELQRHLNAATDGVYGPGTYSALKLFQAAHGLTADGECGPQTWAAVLA